MICGLIARFTLSKTLEYAEATANAYEVLRQNMRIVHCGSDRPALHCVQNNCTAILWVHGVLTPVIRDTLPASASSGSHILYSLSLLRLSASSQRHLDLTIGLPFTMTITWNPVLS